MNTNISFKHINKLAVPALIAGIAEPILSITDTAIIGNIDSNATESLAAVGIVGTFISMLIWVLGQTRSAISSIVSQHLGSNKLDKIKNLPAQAIFIITLLSVLIIFGTYPFARSIFKLYNATNIILDYSVEYYRIRVFGFPFTLFTMAVFGVFRGLQNTFYPMIIATIGAFLNIALDYAFVFGIENYIPAMNIKGAAYGSLIAQITMAVLATIYLIKKTDIPLIPTFPLNKEIDKLVIMILNLFVRTLALNVTLYFATRFATGYGPAHIAAYTICINLWFFAAFFVDGYASAGNILSGKLYGETAYATLLKLSNKLIRYGIIVGIMLAVFGALFYYPLGRLFSKDAEVLSLFYNSFWLVLIMQPFCALAFIFDGMFKGLGKMKFLRNVLLCATSLVFLPVLFWLDAIGYKLHAIFIALTFWIIARGIPLIIKFRKIFIPLSQKS
ncbi:MATE family efflux transporter [Algibacter sp. TI.3.09]|uniref:MATE family efflux transporter n=1 Tax=Algibacter sp. TI.3.09 TaxID=3121298 RepID=UPI0031201F16